MLSGNSAICHRPFGFSCSTSIAGCIRLTNEDVIDLSCNSAGTKAGWRACRIGRRQPAKLGDSGPAPRTIPMGWKTVGRCKKLAEFVSYYGVWLVAVFIALESIGIPLPAEAALMAAAFFAARTHGIDIWSLI